jgi:hypothetical protein
MHEDGDRARGDAAAAAAAAMRGSDDGSDSAGWGGDEDGGDATAAPGLLSDAPVPGGRLLYEGLAADLAAMQAAAVAGGGGSGSGGSGSGGDLGAPPAALSALHYDLLQFAAATAPCAAECVVLRCAMATLGDAARSMWPGAEASLFGSQACPCVWSALCVCVTWLLRVVCSSCVQVALLGCASHTIISLITLDCHVTLVSLVVMLHNTPNQMQACGLALPGSDLDVVLLNVPGCPTPRGGASKGFK